MSATKLRAAKVHEGYVEYVLNMGDFTISYMIYNHVRILRYGEVCHSTRWLCLGQGRV